MQAELRKMAAALRELEKEREKMKMVKCAQTSQAIIALSTLQQKIRGSHDSA